MSKVTDFFKSKLLVIRWTIEYFFVLWLILEYIFGFDVFSQRYWLKFFHGTLHGFAGFVFGALMYSAIPIYIAGAIIINRKKEPIPIIPFVDKIFAFIGKLFQKKDSVKPEVAPETESETEEPKNEFPEDMPPELHVPYMRAKNHLPLTGTISVYNKSKPAEPQPQTQPEPESNFPIPMDFDISDTLNESDTVPNFTDLNFDTPIATEKELYNNTTKYFDDKKIEYETYRNYVATDKYLIYEHNDNDFWIMDEDSWFASGKQIDSPIPELLDIAKQNGLIPVIYFESQNIMDIADTTNRFESIGIRVIKTLEELA